MKSVSGSVVASKPISLSKAASILNSFISFENGVPHALSSYLRRTSESLNELVEFHGELQSKKQKKNGLNNGDLIKVEENKNYSLGEELSNGYVEQGRGNEIKKKKKKSRNEVEVEDGLGEIEERGNEGHKERKKRKKIEEEEELDEAAEVMRSRMKKRKH